MTLPSPFLVVSYTLPVQASGTPVIVRNLLENFSPLEVVLIGRTPRLGNKLSMSALKYPVIRIPSPPVGVRGDRYWMLIAAVMGIFTGLMAIKRYGLKSIVAVFPDEGALLTGYWLHKLTSLPFYPYFCDLYQERPRLSWQKNLANWLQPKVFSAATRIIAVNDGMADYYRERYGIEPLSLPTCINQPPLSVINSRPAGQPFIIGYSGNVVTARLDTIQALVRAIAGKPEYEIRYFTAQSQDELEKYGVWADNARLAFAADKNELVRYLQDCDVLYLPLTFVQDNEERDQLATCFGIKSYEYLVSGRPVLVHCPSEYYTARFFLERECGYVVDELNDDAVLNALKTLRADSHLRQRLVQNAFLAASEFHGAKIADRLRTELIKHGSEKFK
ncbi:hypothetical protein KKG48_04010 [Patescibacteria group bacterium]|nr:hypothetical protein [Patescibacteria group bacterium]